MGLGFVGSKASWSYSGFMAFRCRIAAELGFDLRDMQGFGHIDGSHGGKSWDDIHDSLVPLLNHSDCEGELSSEECAQVAPRLREIVSRWGVLDSRQEYAEYDRERGLLLVETMEECAKAGKPLVFC